MRYKLTNYAMGRPVETAMVEAASHDAAVRAADKHFKNGHGLPGSSKDAAAKSRVVGVQPQYKDR